MSNTNLIQTSVPMVIPPAPVGTIGRSIPDGMAPEEYVKTLDVEQLEADLKSVDDMINDMNYTVKGFRNLKKIIATQLKIKSKE